jgi:hypothetical protein
MALSSMSVIARLGRGDQRHTDHRAFPSGSGCLQRTRRFRRRDGATAAPPKSDASFCMTC